MFRKIAVALIAGAAIGVAALAPTTASAGGYYGGYSYGYSHYRPYYGGYHYYRPYYRGY